MVLEACCFAVEVLTVCVNLKVKVLPSCHWFRLEIDSRLAVAVKDFWSGHHAAVAVLVVNDDSENQHLFCG